MSYFLGQTQTRTQVSAADTQAMDAPSEQWPALCAAGNTLACQLAKISVTTSEQGVQLAQNREAQAQADREAIAQRLISAGINPAIAQAVRTKKDINYLTQEQFLTQLQETVGKKQKLLLLTGALVAFGVVYYYWILPRVLKI